MVNRYNDIVELLNDTKEIISLIETTIQYTAIDPTKKEILKPKIKSSLEQLRSCLEYCAQDIYEIAIFPHSGKAKYNIYFPYGITFNNFKKMLDEHLSKNLKSINNDIYTLIESIQPFISKNNWLTDLCKYTNYNKHNRLHNQSREDYCDVESDGQSLIHISNFKNVYIGSVNNQRVNLHIDESGISTWNKVDPNVLQISNGTNFTFVGSKVNIIELINSAHNNITVFANNLYTLLGK